MPEWLTIKAVPRKPVLTVDKLVEKLSSGPVAAAGAEYIKEMLKEPGFSSPPPETEKPVRVKAPPKQREPMRQRPPLNPEKPYSQGYERAVWGKDAEGKKVIVGWEPITDEEAYS
jgi:hypothetical protein